MNQKIIVGFGIILLLVVIVQSVFLFRMSDQVNRLSQAPETSSSVPDRNSENSGNPVIPKESWASKDWNPFEEMQRMQNEMNKIFGDMRSNLYRSPDVDNILKSFSFSPTLDIQEGEDRFVVKVDIPGSDESNINVKVDDQTLTVSASTKKSDDDKGKGNMFRSERFRGQFERTVALPAPVLADKMKTDYKDGVLTITLPKA